MKKDEGLPWVLAACDNQIFEAQRALSPRTAYGMSANNLDIGGQSRKACPCRMNPISRAGVKMGR